MDAAQFFESPSSLNYTKRQMNFTTNRSGNNAHNNKSLSNEEILLGKYLEKLQNSEVKNERRKLELDSPYLQKLSHSNFLQNLVSQQQTRPNSSTNRVQSAQRSNRPNSSVDFNVQQIVSDRNANNINSNRTNVYELNLKATKSDSLNQFNQKENRSTSAPMRRAESEQSFHNTARKKRKNLYRKLPFMIRAVAFKNGSRENSVYIAAKSLIEFLEIATDRLGFDRAARRLFLENGEEIRSDSQLVKNAVVYVSSGEEFRDPFLNTKRQIDQSKSIEWRSEGVRFVEKKNHHRNHRSSDDEDQSSSNGRNTPIINPYKSSAKTNNNGNRLMHNTKTTKRLIVLENGNEYHHSIVFWEYISSGLRSKMDADDVANLESKYYEEFLIDCKNKIKTGGSIRKLYNWHGQRIKSIDMIPKLDKCLQGLVNDSEYAPIWASKGEEFIARGALLYAQNLLRYVRLNRAELVVEKKRSQGHMDKLNKERANTSSRQASNREREYTQRMEELNDSIREINDAIPKLDEVIKNLEQLNEEQKESGFSSLYKHIKELDAKKSKIVGGFASKGVTFKVSVNGTNETFDLFYSVKDWMAAKVDDVSAQQTHFRFLLNELTKTYQRLNTRASSVKFTRIFMENGEEINETDAMKKFTDAYNKCISNSDSSKGQLFGDSEKSSTGLIMPIWVSQGENWRDYKKIKTLALSLNLNLLFAMKNGPIQSTSFGFGNEEEENKGLKENEEEEEEELKKNEPKETAPVDSDAEFEYDINKYIKQQKPTTTKQRKGSSFMKPASSIYNTDLNIRTYMSAIKPAPKDFYRPAHQPAEYIDLNDEKPNLWEVIGENEVFSILNEFAVENKTEFLQNDVAEVELSKAKRLLIQSKREPDVLLLPQLFVNEKSKQSQSIFLQGSQDWKFNKAGYIYSSFFPKICLMLNPSVQIKLEIHLKRKRGEADFNHHEPEVIVKKGYAVVLGARELNDENNYRDKDMQWSFSKYGSIYSKALSDSKIVMTSTDLLLTELSDLTKNESSISFDLLVSQNGEYTELNSKEYGIFLLESFSDEKKSPLQVLEKSQRWAIKQEGSKSIGEWRFSKLSTPAWHKLALTWPFDENEAPIDQFKWPLSGSLIPGVPPLRDLDRKVENVNIRFRVIKNGTSDVGNDPTNAVYVSKIDSKNLMKEFLHNPKKVSKYREFEFNTFLDSCTEALGLTSAARRIFDQLGVEQFDLTNLKQDQVLYVSTGEAWHNPKSVKEDLDKKTIMAGLSEDLCKIAYFNRLKEADKEQYQLVVEASNAKIQEGARLLLGRCCLSKEQIERVKNGQSIHHILDMNKADNDEQLLDAEKVNIEKSNIFKTSHRKAHTNVDTQDSKKPRQPWETSTRHSKEISDSDDSEDLEREFATAIADSLEEPGRSYDPELLSRFKLPAKSPGRGGQKQRQQQGQGGKVNAQLFGYEKSTGFIYSLQHKSLVLTVAGDDTESPLEVFLARRNDDSINQRWVYRPDQGLIVSRARQASSLLSNAAGATNNALLCLTVRLPPIDMSDFDPNQPVSESGYQHSKSFYEQAVLTVQPFSDVENGCAHQKWDINMINESVGFIYAFATTMENNIEITAANKAGICSYYVTCDKEISQKGYVCEIEVNETNNAKNVDPNSEVKATTNQKSSQKVLLCASCAQMMRGKFKITRLSKNQQFACFIGKTKEKPLKQYDGFKYLHNKADLCANESLNSFKKWHSKFLRLREESNAKLILNEFSSKNKASSSMTIKLYAYKNGAGRNKGELLMGTSIQALLDQATERLQLITAARRFYTEDGTQILDAQDLIKWAEQFYKKEIEKDSKNGVKLNKADSKSKESDKESEMKSSGFSGPTRNELKRIFESRSIDERKLLRWPIEVWVSCGEQFTPITIISPSATVPASKSNTARNNGIQVNRAEQELNIQTHTLRQITGRRLQGLGEKKSNEETRKLDEVNQLKNLLDDVKKSDNKDTKKSSTSSKLYNNANITKRVKVYLNGGPSEKAKLCWASNIEELVEEAKKKLDLNKPIRCFFTSDGKLIAKFEDIGQDQLICASTGREFITNQMRNREIEIKTNWNKARKEEGLKAVKSVVDTKKNPTIDVDPFSKPSDFFNDFADSNNRTTKSNRPPVLALPEPPNYHRTSSNNYDDEDKIEEDLFGNHENILDILD